MDCLNALPGTAGSQSDRSRQTKGGVLSFLRPRKRPCENAAELAAYLDLYQLLMETAFQAPLLDRLEGLHVELFDGSMRPSRAYFAAVDHAASAILDGLEAAQEIIQQIQPPPTGAEAAYRLLEQLLERALTTAYAVVDATSRGYFAALQSHLFTLTREVKLLRRQVEDEHRKLRRRVGSPRLAA